ncbi:Zinc finger RNA-binding protein 2 [Toxocara canis]|uniref:Zinc finger RNA-binding protein 2 n=1 Tax=Toxocara canis TaxID=6265 RepID=A0A0B2V4B9_TOXCA|nr:Zinc finger RNA-binding protein 2 [Toxocara canis]
MYDKCDCWFYLRRHLFTIFQTYKDHVEGKKHKKKEALQKGEDRTLSKSWVSFRCEMCNVTCTGKDTYESHILGSRHQKVNFIGGQKLQMTDGAAGAADRILKRPDRRTQPIRCAAGTYRGVVMTALAAEDMQRVGENYVEEKRNAAGKVVQYICKLCHCKFNDQSAKNTHIRGRKHHLQYKLKMNPELVVDVTPNQIHHERRIEQDRMMRAHSGPPRDDIYPDEAQLNAVEKLVAVIERALKGVSDQFAAKCV